MNQSLGTAVAVNAATFIQKIKTKKLLQINKCREICLSLNSECESDLTGLFGR